MKISYNWLKSYIDLDPVEHSPGVKVSEIKNGIKANSLVATIESHTHNIPTLLIEHLDKSND